MTSQALTRRDLARLSLALSVAPLASSALAQSFPSKPVKIITSLPAGSGSDSALRVIGEIVGKRWQQPVVVENKPGGSGLVAITAFKQAGGDPYVFLQLDNYQVTTLPHLFSKLPYDPKTDLEPICPLSKNYFFVVVSVNSPIKTLDDLVAAARKSPGKITYASGGNGSALHLGALLLQAQKGLEMVQVPFKESTQAGIAVATQEVDWFLASAASAGALEKAGRLRFVVLAAPQRAEGYPQVPATAEQPTNKGYEVKGWTGLFAPRGTDAATRERIASDVALATAIPEVTERYKTFGYERFDLNPQQFSQVIAAETLSWGEVIRKNRIKLD